MDKNYPLMHLLGTVLKNRRIEVGLDQETVSAATGLKVPTIEKSSYIHISEITLLCKYYIWSLSQVFKAVDDLNELQKRS